MIENEVGVLKVIHLHFQVLSQCQDEYSWVPRVDPSPECHDQGNLEFMIFPLSKSSRLTPLSNQEKLEYLKNSQIELLENLNRITIQQSTLSSSQSASDLLMKKWQDALDNSLHCWLCFNQN